MIEKREEKPIVFFLLSFSMNRGQLLENLRLININKNQFSTSQFADGKMIKFQIEIVRLNITFIRNIYLHIF